MTLQAPEGEAQLEMGHHLLGENLQSPALGDVEFPRDAINDAERAKDVASRGDQRRSCVGPDIGFIKHQRIVGESLI